MKKNLKKLKKILILFATLLIVSCSKDVYEEQSTISKKESIVKKVSLKDAFVKQNKKLQARVLELKNYKSNKTGKYEYNETYNFYIDEENGIYIESEGKESYTFPIYKTGSDGTIENIIFNENSSGDFDVILADYDFTKDELQSMTEADVAASETVYTNVSKIGIPVVICVYIETTSTTYPECNNVDVNGNHLPHSNGYICQPKVSVVTTLLGCTGGGGGGESSTGGSMSGTDSGSNPSGNGGSGGGFSTTPTGGLTQAQYQFLSQLNELRGEDFFTLDETTQTNILNYVEANSSNNLLINSIAYFFNNANTLWISNQSAQTQQSIFNYLIANNFSSQSKSFINGLINFCNTNNLNNEESKKHIVANLIEKQINDSNLDPCGKSVLDRLKNLQQNDIAKILTKLNNNSVYNLTISSANPVDPASLGETNWAIDTSGYVIQYNYLMNIHPALTAASSDLAIACTMLHEIVHAYFLSLIDDCSQTSNCTQLQSFPDLWNFYVANQNSGIYTNSLSQHNQIASSYVNILASALQEFVTGIPLGDSQQAMEVYSDVAWIGLVGTIPYNALSQQDKDRINFRWDNVELLNQSATNSNGITINPVGSRTTPCN